MSFYSSNEERVWDRMKAAAAEAAAKRTTIDAREAYAVVEKLIYEEHAESIPAEARRYYAKALQRMACSAVPAAERNAARR